MNVFAPSARRKPKNKYGARKTECRLAHAHDSAREAKRCNELQMLARGGRIADLEVHRDFWFVINGQQLKHPNGRRAGMKVDFVYRDLPSGQIVAEDAKGMVVRDYPLRAALFRALFPEVELREV